MKFLHCADVHLDSPLRGLTRYEGAPVDRLRRATREAFERAVTLALEEHVAFVVIAGDLYDGERDDFQTAMFLQHQLHRLSEAGIPVAMVYGNHDAANAITSRLSLPPGCEAFPPDRAATVHLEAAGAALHGRSYPRREVTEDLSAGYPDPVPGLLNVGVLHTSLDGRPGHDTYAPCTPAVLARRGYAYWALGHVHHREHLEREGVHLVFPGNLCGRHVGETGPKGATLVEYQGDRVVALEHRDLAPVRWERLTVEVPAGTDSAAGTASAAGAADRAVAAIGDLARQVDAELLAVRVVIRAGPDAVREWLRDPERHEAQLQADATGAGAGVWVERVQVEPSAAPSATASAAEPVPGDALAAVREALQELRTDPGARLQAAELLAGLRGALGAEASQMARLGVEGLEEESLDPLLDQVAAVLDAELEGGGS